MGEDYGKVSVLMGVYNCASTVLEAIRSIQEQTYTNWEMIIVDDCSKDDTKEVVEKYMENDSRIKYECLETNSGAAVARTRAMELATGQYMAFLDSDDIWKPEKLEKQLKY